MTTITNTNETQINTWRAIYNTFIYLYRIYHTVEKDIDFTLLIFFYVTIRGSVECPPNSFKVPIPQLISFNEFKMIQGCTESTFYFRTHTRGKGQSKKHDEVILLHRSAFKALAFTTTETTLEPPLTNWVRWRR